MKRFQHTPETAARAIRAGYDCGRLGRIARTVEEFDEQNRASARADLGARLAGPDGWANAFSVCQLVKEQCGGIASDAVRVAIEKNFPELFCEYWENLFPTVRVQS